MRGYTWYANLKPGSIHDFEHLASLFNSKFFYVKTKFSLVKLGRVRQNLGEDLDAYIRRFLDRALYCCDPEEEKMLVDVCLLRTMEEYRILLEILSPDHF